MNTDRSFRNDISLALIHLTGKRGTLSATEALLSILRDGRINGSGNNGYVKGSKTATCFTEMPLSSVLTFVKNSKFSGHPYECYGIAISKQSGWDRGARPVIYLPDTEGNWIPEDQKWRHVRFEFGAVDFSHEREWRSEGDFNLVGIGFYIIVPDREQEDLVRTQLPEVAESHVLGFLHMDILSQFL
jgi:hypothetical protein